MNAASMFNVPFLFAFINSIFINIIRPGNNAIVIALGAAILGRIAGEMIMSDPFMVQTLHNPGHLAAHAVQAMLAVGVVVAAKARVKYRALRESVTATNPVKSPFLLDGWDLR